MSPASSPLRGAIERLSGYVDDLLAERRPRRFLARSADELRLLQAAARLRGARPSADRPDPDFLADLRQRLAAVPLPERASAHISPTVERVSRRRLLTRVTALIAGLAAGVAAGFGVGRFSSPAAGPSQTSPAGVVPPANGRWYRVAALDDVPAGKVVRFSAGTLVGHLVNTGERLDAVSAVCTHLGCILRWSKREREFQCPCHGAAFEPGGAMKYGPRSYRQPLPPLPAIETYVEKGQIYVWTT